MAHQLDYIHHEHLLKGFDFIDNNGVPKDDEWNEYWIVHNNKLYPFKYSLEKASELRNPPIGIHTGNVIKAIKKGTAIIEPYGLMMVLESLSDNAELFYVHPIKSMLFVQQRAVHLSKFRTICTIYNETSATLSLHLIGFMMK